MKNKPIEMGIDVSLVCSNEKCDNIVCMDSSNTTNRHGYVKLEKNVRYVCLKCGKDMTVVVEKITHTELVEKVG